MITQLYQLTQNLISTLPKFENKVYVLADSWYNFNDILTQYTDPWAIESFFRDCITYLGLNEYQVRSEKVSIDM